MKRTLLLLLIGGCLLGVARGQAPSPAAAVSDEKAADEVPHLWTRKRGVDWPSFLGPERNGHSSETGILTQWPANGLRVVWQHEAGIGYGIGSVSNGRYFHFDRFGDQARLSCLNAESGEELWRFEYPTDFVDMYGYDGGPRASPVVDGNRVYIAGAEGMLYCLRVTDGANIWQCDTIKRFGVVPNFFGVGSTPIIEGSLLIAIVGGSPADDQQIPRGQLDRVRGNGTGIVAFDKYSGEVRYTVSNELASYASPLVATINGRHKCLAFCRGGLVAFDVATGGINFQHPWRAKELVSVNASTPVVVGNEVFLSEAYGPGSCLLSVRASGFQINWHDPTQSRFRAMKAHFSTPIYEEGYLYGCSGRYLQEKELRCLDWKTGKIMWSEPTKQRSTLLYVDQHLINLQERGKLQLMKANPRKFELVAEAQLGESSEESGPPESSTAPAAPLLKYPCWSAPILSHGLLYLRGKDLLVCLELIPDREP